MKIYNADLFGQHSLSGSLGNNVSGSKYTGSLYGNVEGTASYAVTASYLLGSIASASYAFNAETASYFVGLVESASYSVYALTASRLEGSVESASLSQQAISASYTLSSSYANISTTASYYGGSVISSSYSVTASYSITSKTASYYAGSVNSSSYSLSASFSNKSSLSDFTTSASSAINTATASYYGGNVLSSSYAITSSFSNKSSLADSATSSSYALNSSTSSFSTVVFSRALTLYDPNGISISGSYYVWRAPYTATVLSIYARTEGAGVSQINATKSGSSGRLNHTGSNLSVLGTGSWYQANSVTNAIYGVGDTLEIVVTGSGVTQIIVQLDFQKI